MWCLQTLCVLVLYPWISNALNSASCSGCQSSHKSTELPNQINKPTFSLRARAGTSDARFDFDTALRLGVIPGKSNCGNQMSEVRVYGGEVAELDEFPWMALLEYRENNISTAGFACSGALVTKRYVLTAAHCTTGRIASVVGTLFNVRLGEYHKDNATDCINGFCAPPVVDVGIEEILYHPEYDDTKSRNRYNDIALIRLSKDVTFSDFIQPLCLPFNTETDYANVGERLWVSGWGKTEKGINSPVKLKVRLPLVDQSNCTKIYKRARVSLRKSQICAGGEHAKDSCRGDSGGPLMTRAKDDPNRWFVEGIVSFGTACGTDGWPGVYTKVSEYTSWILENMRV